MNLLSRKVPGLFLHLLLDSEMRHSYASQTLITLIWGWWNYCARRRGHPQKTITCDGNNHPHILHNTEGLIRKHGNREMEKKRTSKGVGSSLSGLGVTQLKRPLLPALRFTSGQSCRPSAPQGCLRQLSPRAGLPGQLHSRTSVLI